MKNFKKGFTLIELLIVVAIIGIIASVVLAVLNQARTKGTDAAIKSNLVNAMKQAEIFYATNTAASNSYTNVCSTTSPTGGAQTLTLHMVAAAKARGLASPYYTVNGTGSTSTATCNSSATAWAAEVPLKDVVGMWCVDSTGKSSKKTNSIGATTVCPAI